VKLDAEMELAVPEPPIDKDNVKLAVEEKVADDSELYPPPPPPPTNVPLIAPPPPTIRISVMLGITAEPPVGVIVGIANV
jgi:hypothetical protein